MSEITFHSKPSTSHITVRQVVSPTGCGKDRQPAPARASSVVRNCPSPPSHPQPSLFPSYSLRAAMATTPLSIPDLRDLCIFAFEFHLVSTIIVSGGRTDTLLHAGSHWRHEPPPQNVNYWDQSPKKTHPVRGPDTLRHTAKHYGHERFLQEVDSRALEEWAGKTASLRSQPNNFEPEKFVARASRYSYTPGHSPPLQALPLILEPFFFPGATLCHAMTR